MRWQRNSPKRGSLRSKIKFAFWPVTDSITEISYWLETVEVQQKFTSTGGGDTGWVTMRVFPIDTKY